jgi:PAS domain S-box-containing protein
MNKEKRSTNSKLLRTYAEDLLLKKAGESTTALPFTSVSESDLLKLVHELDVHKIELEMKLDEISEIATGMSEELIIANKELAFQNEEKTKRAEELVIANKELAFQNEEKTKRAEELIIANKELAFQNEEKTKRAAELIIANAEIAFQAELIIANSYLENLISHANGPIMIWDTQFCITRFNPAFELLTGRSEAEVLGKNPEILFPPALVEDSMFKILKTLNGEHWDAIELEILHRDGSVRTVLWNSSTLFTPDGLKPIATIAQGQDITDRKKLEEEVKLVSARLAMAANSGGVGVWDHDLVNNILLWNDQMFVLYGIRESDFSGVHQAWRKGLHPDDIDRFDQEMEMAIRGEKEFDTEFRVVWPDGSIHAIRALASVQRDNSGKSVRMIGTKWDISEQKRRELEIKLQNEELQKVNLEKDKFFSIIAHDLRGPLGNFMGMTDILTDESIDLREDERKKMMAGLSLSARNTFTLLGNLLEWAQMAQGLTDFKPQKLELTKVITECIAVLEESAKGKAIQLFVQIVDEPIVFADKNMLQSVIRNLISNAIKFTPTGGEISISTESSANNMTVIFVRDTGIGMTDEMLNNLFRIDANTKRPGTNGEKSTGLGLLLCKEFVGKLGGKITVESEPNKGTVFSFNIPAMERDEKELVVQKEPLEERHDYKIENLNILIAEDDEISMKLISLYVDEFSKQVYSVKTGTDAVKVCRDNQDIDLVLMDIAMPNMDGFEASRQIREFNKTVIIIAQTSYIFANNKEKALAAGFNDYIIKPISKPALIEIIKKHIKR